MDWVQPAAITDYRAGTLPLEQSGHAYRAHHERACGKNRGGHNEGSLIGQKRRIDCLIRDQDRDRRSGGRQPAEPLFLLRLFRSLDCTLKRANRRPVAST